MPFFVAMHSTPARSQRAQRLDQGDFCLDEMLCQFDKVFHLAPVDRLVQRLSGRKVPIQCPDPDASAPGHGLQARPFAPVTWRARVVCSSMAHRSGGAELDFAQGQRERHDRERDQHQQPERVHVAQE